MMEKLLTFTILSVALGCMETQNFSGFRHDHKDEPTASKVGTSTDVGNGHDVSAEAITRDYNGNNPPLSLALALSCGWNVQPTNFSCYANFKDEISPSVHAFDLDIVDANEKPLGNPSSYSRTKHITNDQVLSQFVFNEKVSDWKIKLAATDSQSNSWLAYLMPDVIGQQPVAASGERQVIQLQWQPPDTSPALGEQTPDKAAFKISYVILLAFDVAVGSGTKLVATMYSDSKLAEAGIIPCSSQEKCPLPPKDLIVGEQVVVEVANQRQLKLTFHSLTASEKFHLWIQGSSPDDKCLIDKLWQGYSGERPKDAFLVTCVKM